MCVCPIPRGPLARCVESDRNPNACEEESIGIGRSLERCAYWRDNIIRVVNSFAGLGVASESHPLEIRTHVLRGLPRSLMYLSFGNSPYASTFRDIPRGEISGDCILDIMANEH